ncbi:UbiA family prenyltransferase [Methanocella sp. MCL-LM]|uniref:UbiA family prenyltransferase n=1 Tax=Methanocella sp. MCL-LM TaxID=3412035 RepID=UPI003C7799D4
MPALSRKLKAYWDLTRLEHGLIYAVSFVVSLIIAYGMLPDPKVALAGAIAATAAEMGAFALNDYFDVEVDKKNNRTDRPIVRGEISKNEALGLTIASFIVSVVAAYFIGNWGAFAVVVAMIIFGILYDYKLKEYGIVGNIYIAFTMAAPFLFSSMLFNNSPVLLLLTAMAFFLGLGREIMKGIMDVEGDALRDVKTVARVFGEKTAKFTAVVLYVIAVLLAPIPFLVNLVPTDPTYYHNLLYAAFAALAVLILLYVCGSLLLSHERKTISKARKTTLMAMGIALIAFLLPALL